MHIDIHLRRTPNKSSVKRNNGMFFFARQPPTPNVSALRASVNEHSDRTGVVVCFTADKQMDFPDCGGMRKC